jgi:flagellar biosynthesis protein FliR
MICNLQRAAVMVAVSFLRPAPDKKKKIKVYFACCVSRFVTPFVWCISSKPTTKAGSLCRVSQHLINSLVSI